ncbi:Cwf15/Cwc15 cell cycle control protein [Rozella allomycis CSF55]|uniref:Cwf15/Cwc15 cell cycle control protein n=1 Tax=Rozella allomycis (strain CSF55) TaxID=988480 RepID=A0A075AQW8_ROZAC|nr:Pre-mRNA-splicing factor Cwf15/Cwc15 domain-containing protein [Rozella allomycis CSF55]RKP21062.1 Cwf15/Cwc15 cell cycle control protein [Rozella allomycis CSF55]|eukprot:EPZ31070.1 Pre-mRNA-splicing factor Cwf15/Cwc15 domain-containing protein [Rozella allomycis CSF55]
MTTAHKPTWTNALGGNSIRDQKGLPPTRQFGARDMAAHTKLKLRQPGQNTKAEIQARDLKALLLNEKPDTKSSSVETEVTSANKKLKISPEILDLDKDDDESSDDDSDFSAEEEDDTAELLKELEKIKEERKKEQGKLALEELEREEREKSNRAMIGNPLLNQDTGKLKKKWYDDVIFKNQARGSDQKPKKRFINDLIRSDFHRKFMSKYVQ